MSALVRETAETRVRVRLERTGEPGAIATTSPFLDHMLTALARYAGIGLEVMDLQAACRTYNILVAEERKVAAALLFE